MESKFFVIKFIIISNKWCFRYAIKVFDDMPYTLKKGGEKHKKASILAFVD